MADDFFKNAPIFTKSGFGGFLGSLISNLILVFDIQNGVCKMETIFAKKFIFLTTNIKIKHFSKPYVTNLGSLIPNLESVFQKTK